MDQLTIKELEYMIACVNPAPVRDTTQLRTKAACLCALADNVEAVNAATAETGQNAPEE